MTEWETYTPRPDKPDYSVVIDGQNVPLYRDEDGFLRPRDRYLTAYEADVLRALGKNVRPRPKDTDDEVKRLRTENADLRTQVAIQQRNHIEFVEAYHSDRLRQIDCGWSEPEARALASGWKAATLILAFVLGATTLARVIGWLP